MDCALTFNLGFQCLPSLWARDLLPREREGNPHGMYVACSAIEVRMCCAEGLNCSNVHFHENDGKDLIGETEKCCHVPVACYVVSDCSVGRNEDIRLTMYIFRGFKTYKGARR